MKIKDEIEKIVAQYGQDTLGIYLLERALAQAVGADSTALVTVDGRLPCQTDRYKALVQRDKEVMARVNETLARVDKTLARTRLCDDCGGPLSDFDMEVGHLICDRCSRERMVYGVE